MKNFLFLFVFIAVFCFNDIFVASQDGDDHEDSMEARVLLYKVSFTVCECFSYVFLPILSILILTQLLNKKTSLSRTN
jgi:hypothetical protein